MTIRTLGRAAPPGKIQMRSSRCYRGPKPSSNRCRPTDLSAVGRPAMRRLTSVEFQLGVHKFYAYWNGLCPLLLQKYARMITLAIAAYAHHSDVNA
jgi:hypothetical protein